MRPARLLPLTVAAATVIAVFSPLSAPASASTAGTEHVVLTLTPHDRGLLRAIAAGHAPASSHRAAALDAALASPADVADVAAAARSLGLTVRHTGRLAVSVSGPADVVNAVFGSARNVAPRSHYGHALPNPDWFAGPRCC